MSPTPTPATAREIVPSKEISNVRQDNPHPPASETTGSPVDHLRAWRETGGVSGPRRNPIEKLADNPTSLRMAISAKCFDCGDQDADPAWRWRIGNCGCTTCPLHAVRPYQAQAGRPEPVAIGGAA